MQPWNYTKQQVFIIYLPKASFLLSEFRFYNLAQYSFAKGNANSSIFGLLRFKKKFWLKPDLFKFKPLFACLYRLLSSFLILGGWSKIKNCTFPLKRYFYFMFISSYVLFHYILKIKKNVSFPIQTRHNAQISLQVAVWYTSYHFHKRSIPHSSFSQQSCRKTPDLMKTEALKALRHVIGQKVNLCFFVCEFEDFHGKKQLWKFQPVSLCSFWENQVQSSNRFPYMGSPVPYKEVG